VLSEVFDAVSAAPPTCISRTKSIFRTGAGFEFLFCSALRFDPDELCSWILFGGGQALWDESTRNSTSNR
jgi:hypothetical protein